MCYIPKFIAYVPSSAIKDILTQPDSDGKRSKWIAKLLEYDMEIKPTKLVKGKGLAKLLDDSNCRALGVDYICNNSGNSHPQTNNSQVNENIVESEWYKDILYFLQNFQAPPGMDKSKVRSLKLKVVKYCVNNQTLFWRDPSGFLLRCLDEEEAQRVMSEFHEGVCGGHHFWKSTAYKILRVGYYWPSLFSDVCAKVRACEKCQRFAGKQKLKSLPLKPVKISAPFQQWALDFIGEIHPPSSGQHRWILTATDYFTKWIEVVPTRRETDKVIISFLKRIFCLDLVVQK
jgi:hypothetical protein